MSKESDDLAHAFCNDLVPAMWKRLAPETLKSLDDWMSHLRRRYEQYSNWVKKVESVLDEHLKGRGHICLIYLCSV